VGLGRVVREVRQHPDNHEFESQRWQWIYFPFWFAVDCERWLYVCAPRCLPVCRVTRVTLCSQRLQPPGRAGLGAIQIPKFIYFFICLFIHLFIYVFICLLVCSFIYLSIFLSIFSCFFLSFLSFVLCYVCLYWLLHSFTDYWPKCHDYRYSGPPVVDIWPWDLK
jgi:hypothetical protein